MNTIVVIAETDGLVNKTKPAPAPTGTGLHTRRYAL